MNQRTQKKARAAQIGLGAIIVLIWAVVYRPRSDNVPADGAVITAAAPGPERLHDAGAGTLLYRAASAPEPAPLNLGRELPVIHDIRVDKSTVCRGEENFVTVRATGSDGSDAHLRISLTNADSVGPRMPFRLNSSTLEDLPRVVVEGRGGAQVTAALPPISVRECEVDQSATIDMMVGGASTNEWRFRARVTSGTFAAQTYEWDLGDGARSSSTSPETTHSYRFRTQDKRYSNFLVTVTMRSATGDVLKTSRALGLPNPAFGRLMRHGEVSVFSERVSGSGGEVTRLYHAYPAPVQLEHVQLKMRDEQTGSEAIAGDYPAEALLGVKQLLPGQSQDVLLALPDVQLPDERPLTLVFEVFGSTSDGLPANGVFSTQML